MLYGPDGRPLPAPAKRELARRVAQPAHTGWRRAQQWRSVVATLTPAQLRVIYQALAQGTWCPDFFELAEEIEERDLHYQGVLQQRKLKAAGAPIQVVPASDAAADQQLADDVRERVVEGRGWHTLLLELLDALGKGVACVEIVWARSGRRWEPAHYHRVDPRWLVYRDDDGETPMLLRDGVADAAARPAAPGGGWSGWSMPADPLEPGKFVYHRHRAKSGLATRGGLAYSVSTMYLLKSVAVRDWWSFAELFGLPIRVGKYGQHATDADIQTLEDAIAALAADAGCVIPDSMSIELQAPQSGSGGGSAPALFLGQARWCDEQVSKAVVGQTMTADDGSSRAQAEVHADVRDDLVRDDVRQLCETLTESVVAWYCALNHAGRPAGWPRVELPQPPEAIDVEAITTAVRAGLRVPSAWLRGRLGIPEPADGEEVLTGSPAGPAAPALNAADPGAAAAERALADLRETGAIAADLVAPIRAALDRATDADEFLELAIEAGAPDDLAEDLAMRRFMARVDGEGRRRGG